MSFTQAQYQEIMANVMATFGFTAEDLQANRRGYLSEAQRHRLAMQQRLILGRGIIVILPILLIFGATALAYDGAFGRLMFLLLAGIITSVWLYWVWQRWHPFNRDLREGRVVAETGAIGFRRHGARKSARNPYREIWFEDKRFRVTKAQYYALDVGRFGRLYLLPYSGIVVSAEVYMSLEDVPGELAEVLS